jgi:hypothetical protein
MFYGMGYCSAFMIETLRLIPISERGRMPLTRKKKKLKFNKKTFF